jgi:hypothetical protein
MKKTLLLALIICTTVTLPANAQGKNRLGLPPTSMDSFVRQAGGNADLIYGDEGVVDIPPYDYFDPIHRINAGIYDTRRKGLTTGHGSYLPDAWGADEFTGNEWSMSGAGSQPTRAPQYIQNQPTQGGDPASNSSTANPTSQPAPRRGRGDIQVGAGGTGNNNTVIRSPAQNNPRRYSQ